MKLQTLSGLVLVGLLCQAGFGQAAKAPADVSASALLDDLHRQFETAIKDALQQGRDDVKAIQQKYAEALDRLEGELQDQGQLPDLIVIRDEKRRFSQTPEVPENAVVTTPEALGALQTAWRDQMAAQKQAQAEKVMAIGAKYMQQLSALQKKLTAQSDTADVEAVKAEKDRLLDNNCIREALASKVAPDKAPAVEPNTRYTFYTPGKEPTVSPTLMHPLYLAFPSSERKAGVYYFNLNASVYPKTQQVTTDEGTHSVMHLIPRMTLMAKNNDLPENCKLVVEYFSRKPDTWGGYRRETVEHIPLPKLTRSQAVIVDGEGVTLPLHTATVKSTAKGAAKNKPDNAESKGEREFYGLIISLFNPEGKLVYQQCVPSSLAKECATTMAPAEN